MSHIARISLQSSLLVMNSSITHKICCFETIINRSRNCFGHSSCNNNFDKQLMYFHNNFLVHITIWKCKNKCVLLILFNVTECAQEVLITDTTSFVLVNRRKSLGLEFSLTFLYIDTRMFLPFNCQYNPNIGFLIICLKFCQ